jgi:hypothetical protein
VVPVGLGKPARWMDCKRHNQTAVLIRRSRNRAFTKA